MRATVESQAPLGYEDEKGFHFGNPAGEIRPANDPEFALDKARPVNADFKCPVWLHHVYRQLDTFDLARRNRTANK